MNGFTFQSWWKLTDGRTYAETTAVHDLPTAQRVWTSASRAMTSWPAHVTSCGLSKVTCPDEGPWPREGEAGRDAVLLRSPELGDPRKASA